MPRVECRGESEAGEVGRSTADGGTPRGRPVAWLLMLAVLAMVSLRVVALTSDPYARLDWSAGQLTDEGFYVHNARNVALFGHARTDGFNNMLLAPVLHYLQVGAFSAVGAGSAQARGISVVCSLLMLALFWAALRRTFDNRIAWTATVLLGLDHTSLLYHRMALMDTPAAMAAVAAFYAFVRGAGEERPGARRAWLAACGALVALTVTNRMLCAFLLPAPFVGLAFARRRGDGPARWVDAAAVAAGLVGVLALYAAAWYLPHRAEIAAMTSYYRRQQVQPGSLAAAWRNVFHAVLGDFRGMAPYLFRHTPVVFGLVLLWAAGSVAGWRRRGGSSGDRVAGDAAGAAGTAYLAAWLAGGAAVLAVISYSPSRYYVSVYPALAAAAAVAVWRLPVLWGALAQGAWPVRAARTALAWLLAYHAVEAVVHHGGVLTPAMTRTLLYGLPTAAAVAAWAWWPSRQPGGEGAPVRRADGRAASAYAAALVLVCWLAVNALWLGDWARGLAWTQYDTSRWLGSHLPAGSVLLGDVAPGLCLDNGLVAVSVIPKLCNGVRPVERFAGRPRYIAILDGRWKERYWQDTYPALVRPERRILLAPVLRWYIGVYDIDGRQVVGSLGR